MKVLSFQPGSLYQNGGMGRLLRRLYNGHELDITSLYVHDYNSKQIQGAIKEIEITSFPVQRSWMRWKLRPFFRWVRQSLLYSVTKYRIERASANVPFDVIHVVNHGVFSAILCNEKFLANKQLWTSFHDHYLLCSSFEDTQKLWDRSDRRLMISTELGEEYQRVFGHKEFELITDGVYEKEISQPKAVKGEKTTVYFAGLMHFEYYPLLAVLADAMDALVDKGYLFNLVLRGTQEISFLKNRKFQISYKTDFISDEEIKEELDAADILYLPIKFSEPNFYLYSLSTKMISYIGASGNILYHGPSDSAACNLLRKNEAAFNCVSLVKDEMVDVLKDMLHDGKDVCINAKKLAKSEFDLNTIQNTFWKK